MDPSLPPSLASFPLLPPPLSLLKTRFHDAYQEREDNKESESARSSFNDAALDLKRSLCANSLNLSPVHQFMLEMASAELNYAEKKVRAVFCEEVVDDFLSLSSSPLFPPFSSHPSLLLLLVRSPLSFSSSLHLLSRVSKAKNEVLRLTHELDDLRVLRVIRALESVCGGR